MGLYDTVIVPCPRCGDEYEAQSKGGECFMGIYRLHSAPPDVLSDVNRHAPFECESCGEVFGVRLIGQVVRYCLEDISAVDL